MNIRSTRGAATVLLYGAICLASVGFGGVHLSVVSVCLLLVLGGLFFRTWNREIRISPVGALFSVMALFCLAQMVPLPMWLLEWVSPNNFTSLNATELGAGFGWTPISVDPNQTADRAVRFLTLGLGTTLCANLTRKGTWNRYAVMTLGVALAVLFIGLLLHVSDTKNITGWISEVGFRKPSPFVNTNHGASFFGFVALVMSAWTEKNWEKNRNFAYGTGVAGIASLVLALYHDSVGVAIALVGCAVLVVVLRKSNVTALSVLIAAVVGGGLAVWLDLHTLVGIDFGDTSNRALLTYAAIDAVGDFWRFGSGAGTMDAVIPRYIDWSQMSAHTIPTIENELLEFVVAFGIPFGLIVLAAFSLWFAQSIRQTILKPSIRARWRAIWIAYFLMIALLHFPFFTLGIGLLMLVGIEECRIKRRKAISSKGLIPIALVTVLVLVVAAKDYESAHLPQTYTAQASEKLPLDAAAAIDLAEHAATLDPRPRVLFFVAQIYAKAHDPQRAADWYQRLFQTTHSTRANLSALVRDLHESPGLLLDVLSFLEEHEWQFVVRSIQNYYGAAESTDFALLSIERGVFATAAEAYLANLFLDLGQTELATIWSDSSEQSKTLSIRILLRQKKYDIVVERLLETPDAAPHRDILIASHLLLAQTGGAKVVKNSASVFCASPISKVRLKTCWLAEGRLHEHRQAWNDAEVVFDRIRRRLGDPRPLGHFFLGRGRCKQLLQMSVDEKRARFKAGLKKMHGRCVQH